MERISLRSLELEDLDFLFQIENDPRYWHLSHTTKPYSRADLKAYIQNAKQPLGEALQKRFVISNAEKRALGFIDLYDFDAQHQRSGVGIIIDPQWQKQGIGQKAMSLLEQIAKDKYALHQLYAHISPQNLSSLALFEKCNFVKSSLKKDWYFYNHQYHDMWLYQKIMHV